MNPNHHSDLSRTDYTDEELGELIRAGAEEIPLPPELSDPVAFARKCFGPPKPIPPVSLIDRWSWGPRVGVLAALVLLVLLGTGIRHRYFRAAPPPNDAPGVEPRPVELAPLPREKPRSEPTHTIYPLPDPNPSLSGTAQLIGNRVRVEIHHNTARTRGILLRVDARWARHVASFDRNERGQIGGATEMRLGTIPGAEFLVLVLVEKDSPDESLATEMNAFIPPEHLERFQVPVPPAEAADQLRQFLATTLREQGWSGTADDILVLEWITTGRPN